MFLKQDPEGRRLLLQAYEMYMQSRAVINEQFTPNLTSEIKSIQLYDSIVMGNAIRQYHSHYITSHY